MSQASPRNIRPLQRAVGVAAIAGVVFALVIAPVDYCCWGRRGGGAGGTVGRWRSMMDWGVPGHWHDVHSAGGGGG